MPGKVSRTLRFHGTILKESMAQFSARNAMTHAAAMAYYMVFSLPPILFIVIWTAARFYREALMHRALAAEIGELVGEEGARQLMATIERLNLQEPTWGATIIGVGAMIFTATTVLVTARDALNRIADAKPAGKTTGNFWTMLLSRLVSTAMLGIAVTVHDSIDVVTGVHRREVKAGFRLAARHYPIVPPEVITLELGLGGIGIENHYQCQTKYKKKQVFHSSF